MSRTPLRSALPPVLAVLFALPVLSACASSPAAFGGTRSAADERAVWTTTMRWIHQNYVPSQANGTPGAYCLAVGRRAQTALDRTRRDADETWTPGGRLLNELNDLQPPVVPVGECEQADTSQEHYGSVDGPPGVVVVITHPDWVTPNRADLEVYTRENNSYRYDYDCRLERRQSDWIVMDCI